MATKLTGCLEIAAKMHKEDQDRLLNRVDQYIADGIDPQKAQVLAVTDMLAEIRAERQEFDGLMRQQHPDLFTGKHDIATPEGKFAVAKELADYFIGDGAFKTIIEARKKISEIIGKPIEAATELAKQADETIETAVVLAGREIVQAGRKQGRSSEVIYDRLLSLYNRQPNLAVRSSTSVRQQAYSTPVPLAYVASELAGITYDTKVLEPTAGNGMLLVGASLGNSTANELNDDRLAMLQAIGFKATQKNAATEQLRHPGYPVDAVIANPPFGITKDANGETVIYKAQVTPTDSYETREVDHAIVFKALESMKDDGRAVLIVGGVNEEGDEARRGEYRGKSKRTFYFNLYGAYNVTDHFTVDGGLYSKQGASYPVDVIVIEGRGKSTRALPAADLPQIITSYEALKEKLNGTRSVGTAGVQRPTGTVGSGDQAGTGNAPGVAGSTGPTGDQSGSGSTGVPAASVQGSGTTGDGRPAGSGAVSGSGQSGAANQPQSGSAGQVPVSGNGQQQPGSPASIGGNGSPSLGGVSVVSGDRVESGLTDRRGEEQETETQVEYTPHSRAASVGTLVPRAMRDSIDASLQKIEDQLGNLDEYVAERLAMDPETVRSNFSAEQVDALALAIKNAEEGRGFIIGDQTGIGKGRVVAAMIRYAITNDKTPVFVTEKPNLYSDMIRDLDDIGMTDDLALDTKAPKIFITNGSESIPYTLLRTVDGEVTENNLTLKAPKSGKALDEIMQKMMEAESLGDYKVIFTTYSQLQTVKGKDTQRQKFVRQFGSANFMIFDESHNAGGAGETQARTKEQRESAKKGESLVTGRASFVRNLVNNAFGTFFSSATYAKRPDVMDLYSSTNMKLAVDKISQLGDAIKNGGVPMQQVVANMLTKDGQYIRRERTFAGVSYDTQETKVDKQTAENMASAMRAILAFSRAKEAVIEAMQKQMDAEGSMVRAMGGESMSVQGANFGSIMHNLIDQMLLSLKAQESVKHAIDRLKAGEKVVMTVSNTMGSFLQSYAEEMGLNMGDPVALSFKDLYDRYLEKQRVITVKDGKGQKTQKRLTDQELGSQLTAQFNAIRTQIANAGFGSAPISPIDYLHSELRKAGFKTDEITGRTVTLNYESGTPVLTSRTANIRQRVNAVRNFNNGQTDVIILNQAGSTGLSLHASSKFKDQRKRHMIIVQAEKNIDTHMQMLGRVHRTGQVVAPAYSQMMADIPAEMRPAAVLMKKMASLNANTTASRKSAVTAEGVVDFMNDYGGQVVHEYLRDNPEVLEAIGGSKVIKPVEDSEDASEDDIRKFTGYVPILPIDQQETIYRDLIDRYNELIERENTLGTNKLEAKAVDLDAQTVSSTTLTEDKGDPSVFASPANMEQVDVKRTVKPYTGAEVQQSIKENLGDKSAAQLQREMMQTLNVRGDLFNKERLIKMKAAGADEVKLANTRDQLSFIIGHTRAILENYKVGDSISIKDKLGQIIYGVITNMTRGERTANPASPSDWKMQIALANGDAKTLTLNFGQIGSRYQLARESTVQWYNAETQKVEPMRVTDIFDKGSTLRREKRWMVTGNILAGFAKYPGQIISYTKKDGTTGQGVLMNRQFDFAKELKNQPVGAKDGDMAMKFLDLGAVVGTPDGVLRVNRAGGRINFIVPSAKREGGTYFLDQELTKVLGSDFYKRGSTMVATVWSSDEAVNAFNYLIKGREETLIALSGTDRVKAAMEKAKAEGVYFNARETDTAFDYDAAPAELVKKNPTETEARNVRTLNSAVSDYLRSRGVDIGNGVLGYVPATVQGDAGFREIESAFGQRVQWFTPNPNLDASQRSPYNFFNGAVLKGVTYLRANTDRPHLSVLGHEIVHQFRKDHPELYDDFVEAVRPYIHPGMYRKFLETPVAETATTADKKHEEFMAEVGSDAFMEPDFWAGLAEKSPALLRKVAEIAIKLIKSIMAKVGYTPRTAQYLTDYAKVMEAAQQYLGEYAVAKSGVGETELAFQSFGETAQKTRQAIVNIFGKTENLRTFNWYDTRLSTQYNKALKDRHFGKVFAYVNAMQNEVSLTSIRPAELAPGILHKIDDFKNAAKTLVKGRTTDKSLDRATTALFAGTLAGKNVIEGRVWTEDELRNRFGLDDAGVALYKQARAAIDSSLDEIAAAEAYALAQSFVDKGVRRDVIDNPQGAEAFIVGAMDKQLKMARTALKMAEANGQKDRAADMGVMVDLLKDARRRIQQVFVKAKNLKAAGYAPLMRFGDYTVNAVQIDPNTGTVARDENGDPLTIYFGMFETQAEANAKLRELRSRYAHRTDVKITGGTKSLERHKLYAGISPETLALFAEEVGSDTALKKYYEVALSERSALKRRLERKNIAGFSEDLPRVLSNFITSNGRFAAQRYYARDLNNAIKFIPKEKGDVMDEAIKLREFMNNPQDAGAASSSALFAWFLGGSVASAVTNLTQPFMMTMPYLSQYGVVQANKAIGKAMPYVMGAKQITDPALRDALKRASQEGIVEAQEIFHLYSQGAQGVSVKLANALSRLPGAGKVLREGTESMRARSEAFFTLWGMMFSAAESFNRKLTFLAAWDVANARGEKNPYAFAVRAVNETQGIYNKANRPNWARSGTGRVLFTFKQFSLMYIELLNRMARHGGPEGKKAAAVMLGVLFLAAGAQGLPFADDLDDLIDTIGQRIFGWDTNAKRTKRDWVHKHLGQTLGDFALYGVSSMLPLDFSGRMSLGNLIPGSSLLKSSEEGSRSRDLAEVLGPAASLFVQAGDAFDALTAGNYRKAAENMAPKAIRDVMQGTDMAATGSAKDTKGRKNMDVTPTDAAIKTIGFQPTRMAEASRARGPVMQDRALQKNVESDIVDMWARGVATNDQKMVNDAAKRLENWNRKNPDTPVVIRPDQIRSAARQYLTDQNTRILKSTPRELRGSAGAGLINK